MKVGLVQINNSFSRQNYLPYSVGLLQAYAQENAKEPDRLDFLLPIYTRIPVPTAIQHLLPADLIGFSTYVWNFHISLEIAKQVKALRPDCLIVFGGPHIPDKSEEFLRQNPFIDITCHGEGESVFLSLLENSENRDWSRVPSISYIDPNGEFVQHPKNPRIKDLSSVPSPYLENVFTPLMEANPSEHWLALWETNRGCPFGCTFCDWGSAVQSKVYPFDLDRLYQELDWFSAQKIEFIFCCDANFGILPRDVEIAKYAAQKKHQSGYPQALSVQNTKNAIERAYYVQKILADAGLNKGVTISLQSMDPQTLDNVKRKNIITESFQQLQRRFNREGIETYTDVILGLPGETYETFADGVSTIIENGQHNRIQFNNLALLPNAEMSNPAYQKKHGLTSVETRIINIHGSLQESDTEISETQQLVISTHTLPKEDWVRARVFSWMAGLLHFDKILQIPFLLFHKIGPIRFRQLIEIFSESTHDSFPILNELRSFFIEKARDIQSGGPEYYRGEYWLNIWWPADEYFLIKLCVENKLQEFYQEAEDVLNQFLVKAGIEVPNRLLHECLVLNHGLIKLPFQVEDLELELSYKIWEYYLAELRGEDVPLENKPCFHHIDRTSETWHTWDEWCREVIWYGNKKGAYLYGNLVKEYPLAGHY